MFKELPLISASCKSPGCDEQEKVLKLIQKPQSCPTKGFLPLLHFSNHCPPHLHNHNVYNLERKTTKTKFPVEFLTPRCRKADPMGTSHQ